MITFIRSLSPALRSLSLSKGKHGDHHRTLARPSTGSGNEQARGWPHRWALAVWHELPLLLVINAAFCLTLVPAVLAYGTATRPLAPLLAAIFVGPVWATAIRFGERALDGERTTLRDLGRLLRRCTRTGIVIAAVPAIAASAYLATASLAGTLPSWLVRTGWLDAIVLILGLIATLAGYRLAGAGVRGVRLWLDALTLAGRRPMITLGTAALGVLIMVAAGWLPSVLVVLPGPFAFFLAMVGHLLTEPSERTIGHDS